jgi:hypothetical protein
MGTLGRLSNMLPPLASVGDGLLVPPVVHLLVQMLARGALLLILYWSLGFSSVCPFS